jgi:hypothetical protein
LFPKALQKANISEQVIPITVSKIERGIENPCIDVPNTAVIQCPVQFRLVI